MKQTEEKIDYKAGVKLSVGIMKDAIEEESFKMLKRSVFNHSRKKEFVFERQAAMYVIKNYTSFSLADVGVICSNGKPFDHSTVLHACRTVENENYLPERIDAVDRWSAAVFRILGKKTNEHVRFIDLFKRIERNLKLSLAEVETLEEIKEIVAKKFNIFI